MCPDLPFYMRFSGQCWHHNIIHYSICSASFPLASRLRNIARMCDKANTLDDISQLTMGIHCLGHAAYMPQRKFALWPGAAIDNCHAARY